MTSTATRITISALETTEGGDILARVNTVAGEYLVFQDYDSDDYFIYSRWDGVPPSCHLLQQEGETHQTYLGAMVELVGLVALDAMVESGALDDYENHN